MKRLIVLVSVLALSSCNQLETIREIQTCERQLGGAEANLANARAAQAAAERKAQALEEENRALRAEQATARTAPAAPAVAETPAAASLPAPVPEKGGRGQYRVALLVKNLGNGFFEAARDGGQEAAQELGNVELIYTGPPTPTPEGQIEVMNSLIERKVNAIVVSANDPDSLVQVSRKAMQRGITVISFDSGVSKGGRLFQINPSSPDLIGLKQIQMVSKTIGGKGEIAILSATAQATNQNTWIRVMKKVLERPEYAGLKLVDVVYGDDQADKSYREAVALLQKHPNLKAIIAPTTVGIAASAKAVTDQQLVGKVFVTGLGLPSELASYVHGGAVDTFAIWNPVDLGYTAVYAAHSVVTRKATGKQQTKVPVGRMGSLKIDQNGETAMAEPFVFDKNNVDRFAKFF